MKKSFYDKKYCPQKFLFGLYVHKMFSNNWWKYIHISVVKEIKVLINTQTEVWICFGALAKCVICWTQIKLHNQIETILAIFRVHVWSQTKQYSLDVTSTGQFLWSISSRETQTFYLKKPKENPPKKDRRRKVLPFKSTLHG